MKFGHRLIRSEDGAAAVEIAFALPILVLMLWILAQLATVYRALAGIQMALGEGARYATLCIAPTATGCSAPSTDQVKTQIENSVYGLGPGTFTVADPTSGTSGSSQYYDLKVTYTQPTSLLFVPGPTVTMVRQKRVWVAAT
ncbi:MAG: TadE/TadG family type IV pilus assembly protein [Sphingomicrobium sp.]